MEENTSKIYVGSSGVNPMIAAVGTGSPLFVINLCASIAPVQTAGRNLPGLDNYRLYQVARVEDGRTRHRLRLGFFTSESHAESVLTVVRQQYPTAFTACLCDEDRKFTRGYLPDTAIAAPVRPVSVVATPAPPVAAKQTPPVAQKAPVVSKPPVVASKPAAPAPTARAAKPAASKTLTTAEPEVIEVTWEPEPAATAKPAAATAASAPTQPALSADAGLDEFTWEPPALEPKAASRNSSDTARHPVLAPVFKTQPVTKAAPAAARSGSDTSASMRVPALKLSSSNSMRVPALKSDTAATTRVPALKVDIATSARVATLRPDTAASARVAALKPDTAASMKVPALKADTTASMKVPALKPDTAASTRVPALKTDPSASMRVPALSLREPPPAPAAKSPTAGPAQPFHVGKGVDIAHLDISLESDLPTVSPTQKPANGAKTSAPAARATPAAPAARPPVAAKAAPIPPKAAEPAHKPAAATPALKAPLPIAAHAGVLPDLDSTQTIRALTNDEINDGALEKWFAIQLAASEQPVNLDAMPRLDIFEAYRLYSVASAGSGRIVHSLRLGFFKEAVSAEAVGGYLKTFFGAPTVLRVSVAEHARFKDAPAPKPAPAPKATPKSEARVLEFNQTRSARPVIPTVTMEVSTAVPDTSATGSFRTGASGSFKVGASGRHKALTPPKSGGPTPKRSPAGQRARAGNTGRHKALQSKSLSQELMDEAREVELSASGIRKLPKNDSLLSRLVDKLKK